MKKRRQLELKARDLLRELELDEIPVDVFGVAEALGVQIQMDLADEELSGALYRDNEAGPLIGVNGRHHKNRQRFTVAHEIGHLLLHDESVFVDRVFHRSRVSSEAIDPLEIEANGFAAALLMPEDLLLAQVDRERPLRSDTVEDLARRFEVSAQAMAFRLENLRVPLDLA